MTYRPLKAAVAAFLLSGCTAIDYSKVPPSDWPKLKHYMLLTSVSEVQRICGGHLPLTFIPTCTSIDFEKRQCWIVASSVDKLRYEHEKAHCYGWDHVTDNILREAWEEYKRKGQ